ncbi:MAG: hypothetical protein HYY16_17795 [Planctomycetes bacterium]|nr:hypothetical protein [Planctomycetota bacterium]
MKTTLAALLALLAVGCRMAPELKAPHILSSEFGMPLARAGDVRESDISRWQKADVSLAWPATLAVLQVHRDNRYVAVSQGEWDAALADQRGVKAVNILDGLGVGDESLHAAVARHPEQRQGPPEVETDQGLFVVERWTASAAQSDLLFVYATKVATDTYWNMWTMTYFLLLTIPVVPAEEQTAQAVAKGFLIDVKTGKILETAGAVATESRTANPVIINRPMFQLEQQVARQAETRMIEQLGQKIESLRARLK